MQCEMCGMDRKLITAEIEGTELRVCADCVKYGKIVRRPNFSNKRRIERPEIIETIRTGYSRIIKDARERTGLKQEDLASQIAEKESVIHQLESGHLEPSIRLAKKLEKRLGIKLVEIEESETVEPKKVKSGAMTLGDLINIRKK